MKELEFLAIDDEREPDAWADTFRRFWAPYRAWYRRAEAPPARACTAMLQRHMPELVPWHAAMLERLDEDPHGSVARFLTQFCPPIFACACTQAIVPSSEAGPALIRNYDYDPDLCDGVLLRSRWTDRVVLATTDCLVGALDGVNDRGLAVALAFGGRRVVGNGFGIPIVVRYILETCATVEDAIAALDRIPVHMAHTVAMVDRTGAHATVFVSPDRGAEVHTDLISTNHQNAIEWPEHAARTASVERRSAARALVDVEPDPEGIARQFLAPPLYRTEWGHAAGTVYTLVLLPASGTAHYLWPDDRRITLNLDAFPSWTETRNYGD